MQNLRMELNRIQIFVRILRCCHRAVRRVSTDRKARRNLGNVIVMAHPADGLRRYLLKKHAVVIHRDLNLTVFPDRRLLHLAAQHLHHNLCAIAKTEHRNPHLKKFPGTGRRPPLITTVRASRQYDTLRIHLPYFRQICLIRINLTVDITLSNTSRHQLIVLSAEIQYDNCFSVHFISPS